MAKKRVSIPQIQVTILGCGTSTGVPVLGCKCSVCRSRNPKNHRLRASIWIQIDGKSFLVDSSTDLREQALRAKIPRIDAVLYTHPHADHISGIDELRSFNFIQKESIPIYGNKWTIDDLTSRFKYIFSPGKVEGGGIPRLIPNLIDGKRSSIQVQGVKVVPIPVDHGSMEVLGYRINSIAYVTDCSYIPSESKKRLRNLDLLILDCVRLRPHRTHFNLQQALETIEELKPKRTLLSHLGDDFEYKRWQSKLPKGVSLAYDGLKWKN